MPRLIETSTRIEAAGTKKKIIDEFIGNVNTSTENVSIAIMHSPTGWEEPGQQPDFDEYTVVLKGMLRVTCLDGTIDVNEGQAIIVDAHEWVQYSTPYEEGADYVSVCIPAFSPSTIHRNDE
ncbi:MAG TPA: cupin [Candidatus Lokiarchaeia archaeon]|nr:cupin [Candidatus Lokiarchaeia archaeon]